MKCGFIFTYFTTETQRHRKDKYIHCKTHEAFTKNTKFFFAFLCRLILQETKFFLRASVSLW